MSQRNPAVGLVLPNRGVVTGHATVAQILQLARAADAAEWDAVWVGDSLLAKPRLDAIVLLSAIAALTTRVRLGPACMASTPLRNPLVLAYQWACLDVLSGGRTTFVACQGQPGASGGEFTREYEALGIQPGTRLRRMEEAIEVLRLVSQQTGVSYHGQHFNFDDLTIEPHPVQQPLPIWLAVSPDVRKPQNAANAYRRVARLADGWMTTLTSPEDLRTSLTMIRTSFVELERDMPSPFDVCLYVSINVNAQRTTAIEESTRFLEAYYDTWLTPSYLEPRVAAGPAEVCAERLRGFLDAGVTSLALRLTGFDQEEQFRLVNEQVLPLLS